MALTKSLHTVTAALAVATYIKRNDKQGYYGSADRLAADALTILGYHYGAAEVGAVADDTVQRIVKGCGKLLEGK